MSLKTLRVNKKIIVPIAVVALLAAGTTDDRGRLRGPIRFTVPADALPGPHVVTAIDDRTNYAVTTVLVVT